jgi:sialic acid synthase SpsE
MNTIKISDREIGAGNPCFIIAEAGSNHDGNIEQAYKLIDVAVEAGVDAVKFQLFSAEKIAARTKQEIAKLRDEFEKFGDNLFDFYKKLEMPVEWLGELKEYCNKKGIVFLTTPFDEGAVDDLAGIDVAAYKIASFEMVHIPLVKHVAKQGKPVIVSTGMGDLADIEDVVRAVTSQKNEQLILLHCGISYPMPFAEVHLAAMDTMRQAFQFPVGYSDHTEGITVPLAAVARGANMIEKHYTLDKNLDGPDHTFALDPNELKQMVDAIRNTEKAIGSPIKKLSPSETVHYERGRRSVFAAVDIPKGTAISEDMLEVLRPGIGLAPKFIEVIVGRKIQRDVSAHEPITWEDI